MKVAKFGGSSLADANQMKKVVDIVLSDSDRRIVVVSAPGKRYKSDVKVTDLLISLADVIVSGKDGYHETKKVLNRFKEIIEDLTLPHTLLSEIVSLVKSRITAEIVDVPKFKDSIKALGEDISAQILAAYINTFDGVSAEYTNPYEAGLFLSDEFGNAQILKKSYKNLSNLKDSEAIIVFPGFFGYTEEGDVATFPRGGSDITGSILANAVDASLYENFTDVDSVFAASPAIIDNPVSIDEFTYREMRELSYGGFNVIHAEALQPVFEANITVHILNTNNPTAKGTKILSSRKYEERPIIGVSAEAGFSCIYVSKYLMNREIGFGRKLLGIIEDEGISYEHTPSGIDDISVIVRRDSLTDKKRADIIDRIREELDVDSVHIEDGLALLMVVGEGMQESRGVACQTTGALTKANVNIEMINQGASEVSIMVGVKEDDIYKAVKSVYATFFGDENKSENVG